MLNRNLRSIGSIGMMCVIAATLLVLMTGTAGATALPIVGPPFGPCNSNGSGCLNGGNLSVQVLANTCINFYNGNNPDVCGVPGDTFSENAPLDATIFNIGAGGTTKDLIFGGGVVTQFLTAPGPLGTVFFDLESVINSGQPLCNNPSGITTCSAGIFTLSQQDLNANGGNCPPGQSPCGQVTVSFGFNADAYLGTHGSGFTPYVINYSSQFNNETIADLLAKAGTGTGPTGGISNSVSFTANPLATPEPAGFLLIGAGLVAISLIARRRSSRA
jgi:hypothetical protein